MAAAGRANSSYDCSVCCERYKSPKVISCGHSFCLRPCLQMLVQSSNPKCPLCRTSIHVPPSGKAEDLPTNFALQSLVETSTTMHANASVQVDSGSVERKQKNCLKHGKDFVVYCKTCSQLLCQTCLREHQNQDHDTIAVQEAVNEFCSLLAPVLQDLVDLKKKSDGVFNNVKEAKNRCQIEADSVRAKVNETSESVIQLVKERAQQLHRDVDKKEDVIMKQLHNVEAKGAELSLTLDYTIGVCEKLQTEIMQLEFKRKIAVDSLSEKTATLLKDMSALEEEAGKEQEYIVFEPSQTLRCSPLGELSDSLEGREYKLSLFKLKDVSFVVPDGHTYKGFTLCSTNDIMFVCQAGLTLCFTQCSGQSAETRYESSVVGDISNLSAMVITKVKTSVIIGTGDRISMISFNIIERKKNTYSGILLSDALLYQVCAVSWDEQGENCYALLDDGFTIKQIIFKPKAREVFHLRLEENVKCTNSRGFHVSKFGMAICEEDKGQIRFYETVQSPASTRIIRSPSGMGKGCPVCVMSLNQDKKWCVLWKSNTTSSAVYQYSASFEEESVLVQLPNCRIQSFCFLDGKYMAADYLNDSKVTVSVYNVERVKNDILYQQNSND